MQASRKYLLSSLVMAAAMAAALPLHAETAAPLATPKIGEPAPEWADQVKQPTSWLKWGADERVRWEYINNAITLPGNQAPFNSQLPDHEWSFQRYRTRVWSSITPCEEFELYIRLAWEGRHWCKPDSRAEWDNSNVFFDNLYGKVKLDQINTSVKIGRQDIILGDGWLVLDGTPLDGSTSIYFDAVNAVTEFKDINTTVNAIFIDQTADMDTRLPTMGSTDRLLIEQDERGAILYVTNKSLKDTQVDGYFMYKHDNARAANGDNADIYTFGSRIAHAFSENIKGRVEGAGQFGNRNDASICAFGLNSRLGYYFNDAMKNGVYLSYEYLSGDNPGTSTNEAFDPLWARWPQWSELYVYSYADETRIAETTNLQRIGLGYEVSPSAATQLSLNYHALFANQNTREGRTGFSDDGMFRGHLFTGVLRHKFNRFVSGHLLGEYLVPGDYYSGSSNDPAAFLRAELVFTF